MPFPKELNAVPSLTPPRHPWFCYDRQNNWNPQYTGTCRITSLFSMCSALPTSFLDRDSLSTQGRDHITRSVYVELLAIPFVGFCSSRSDIFQYLFPVQQPFSWEPCLFSSGQWRVQTVIVRGVESRRWSRRRRCRGDLRLKLNLEEWVGFLLFFFPTYPKAIRITALEKVQLKETIRSQCKSSMSGDKILKST